MLVTVDDSAINEILRGGNNELSALENILTAHFEGNHIIFFESHRYINKLLDLELSQRSKATLKKISSEISFTSGLKSQVSSLVRIVHNQEPLTSYGNDGWRLPIKYFQNASLAQPTKLIGEHFKDCELFIYAAEHTKIQSGLGKVKLSYEIISGGGGTTNQCLQKEVDNKSRFSLCITDSDQKHPKAKLGDTATKCSKACKKKEWIVFHEILDAHEIENIISIDALRISMPDKVDLLKKYQHIINQKIRKYVDLKSGLYLKIAFAENTSPEYKNFLISESTAVGGMRQCVKNNECKDRNNCSCAFIDPLGDKISESILRYFKSKSPHCSLKEISNDLTTIWNDTGKLVLFWCCSFNRIQS